MFWQQQHDGQLGLEVHLPQLPGKSAATAQHVAHLAVAPEGWLIACTQSGSIAIWNYLRCLNSIPEHMTTLQPLAAAKPHKKTFEAAVVHAP